MIKNMKACLLDKVVFKQEESLSVTAEAVHVGRREWAHTHSRRNPGQKKGVVVFPTSTP